jgi:hypothetical protein
LKKSSAKSIYIVEKGPHEDSKLESEQS